MKGDTTRSTFDKTNHYSSVRWQQGRVHVDADWNEEMEILAHWDRTTRRDVIGSCGGPAGKDADGNPRAGFLIDVNAGDGALHISPGRYYVDGLLVENEAAVAILQQPDLPPLPSDTLADILTPKGESLDAGVYLAYLDVWERHISALEDPAIREVALGGPDTATRSKVVWQVKLMPVEVEGKVKPNCGSDLPLWSTITQASTGRLTAKAEAEEGETDPCIVPAQAGYRGLENQLYRVEVHRIISTNKITIKWSRENGSVVSAWLGQDSINPNRITVKSTGRDKVLGFAADDWVELTDDVRELRGLPGRLVQIQTIEGDVLVINPGGTAVDMDNFPQNPKVRRWDMPSDVGEISVDLTAADNWIELESGVQVKLDPGLYHTGDYWTIPARTATREIEWPQDDAPIPAPLALLPRGIQHHFCRLALFDFDGEVWTRLTDCRNIFPPLTEMVRFFHVGGDGQEAMPSQAVPQPLQVGVSNGQWPVKGAQVAFRILRGTGRLEASGGTPERRVIVATDAQGIAECRWTLDSRTLSQRVQAILLDIDGKPFVDDDDNPTMTPLIFNANLSVASQVAYDPRNCSDLSQAQTVQQAIDMLCQRPQGDGCCVTVGEGGEFQRLDEAIFTLMERGERDICICLLAGDHSTISPSIQVGLDQRDLHLTIHGCGLASRLTLEDKPWILHGLHSLTLRDMFIEPAFEVNNAEGAISIRHCSQVSITGCTIVGFTPEGPLLSIADGDQVRLRDNVLEASRFNSFSTPQRLFTLAEIGFLVDLYSTLEQGEFRLAPYRERAFDAANQLAGLGADERKGVQTRIATALNDQELRRMLTSSELLSIAKLQINLAAETVNPENLFDLLNDVRRAAIKARPGLALVLGETFLPQDLFQIDLGILDDDDLVSLESNEIAGVVSLYGLPASRDFLNEVLNENFLEPLTGQLKERRIVLNGLLGTLNIRGNQLVQITITSQVIETLLEALNTDASTQLIGIFGRCLFSDNVFEAGNNLILNQHMSMNANDFKMTSMPVNRENAAVRLPSSAGIVMADSSIYMGNHARGANTTLRNVSRVATQAANLELAIIGA